MDFQLLVSLQLALSELAFTAAKQSAASGRVGRVAVVAAQVGVNLLI